MQNEIEFCKYFDINVHCFMFLHLLSSSSAIFEAHLIFGREFQVKVILWWKSLAAIILLVKMELGCIWGRFWAIWFSWLLCKNDFLHESLCYFANMLSLYFHQTIQTKDYSIRYHLTRSIFLTSNGVGVQFVPFHLYLFNFV